MLLELRKTRPVRRETTQGRRRSRLSLRLLTLLALLRTRLPRRRTPRVARPVRLAASWATKLTRLRAPQLIPRVRPRTRLQRQRALRRPRLVRLPTMPSPPPRAYNRLLLRKPLRPRMRPGACCSRLVMPWPMLTTVSRTPSPPSSRK